MGRWHGRFEIYGRCETLQPGTQIFESSRWLADLIVHITARTWNLACYSGYKGDARQITCLSWVGNLGQHNNSAVPSLHCSRVVHQVAVRFVHQSPNRSAFKDFGFKLANIRISRASCGMSTIRPGNACREGDLSSSYTRPWPWRTQVTDSRTKLAVFV